MEDQNYNLIHSRYIQLQRAISAKDVDFVNSIIYKGSSFINIVHPKTYDAELHLIVLNDAPEKNWTEKFLHLGSNINARNAAGDTPLHKLISVNRFFPSPKMLIKNGADMHISNKYGISPFQIALLSRGLMAIEMFHPEKHIHPGNYSSLVKDVLNYGLKFNLNLSVSNYSTILHFAVEFADIEMFKCLLNNTEFDINALSPTGTSLLNYAILKRRDIEIIKALLDHGAKIHKRSNGGYVSLKFGYNALHNAVMTKALDIVKLLLNKGADINAQSINGLPLHIVCEKSFWSEEKAKLLLDFGANIHARNLFHQTPIQKACLAGNFKVVKFLLQHGANIRTKCRNHHSSLLHFAAFSNNFDTVKLILDLGLDPNEKDSLHRTPIFYAIHGDASSSVATINILLKYGADINAADIRGNTVLHWSCNNLHFNSVEVFIKLKANINALNNRGLTPLECALKSHRKYNNSFILNKILNCFCVYIDLKMSKGLSKERLDIIKNDPLVRTVYSKYEREINLMKNERILSSISVCYFDLLQYDEHKLAILARNKPLMGILASGEYVFKFPLYSRILCDCIKKGKKRRNLIERNAIILKEITKKNFPYFITDIIFSSLSLKDLKNLTKAYQAKGNK